MGTYMFVWGSLLNEVQLFFHTYILLLSLLSVINLFIVAV